MNVAYVLAEDIPFHGRSGASAHIRNVVKQLERREHSIEFVSRMSPSGNESGHSSEAAGDHLRSVASVVLPETVKTAAKDWWTRRENRRLIQENVDVLRCADVIYERDAYQSFGMIEVRKRIDTPWVVECNGIYWYGESPFADPVWLDWYKQKKVQKWENADHVIVVSEKLKHQIAKEGIKPSKISVIHNGVNINPYRKISRNKILEFKSTQEFDEKTVIGFMGHIHPKHKVELFVDALHILSDMGYMIHGLVVGGGRWKNYRKYASNKGIKSKITFTGSLPPERVPVAVSSMDICTIPGVNNHDSPVKLFEYGAAGCPVVSVSTPNVKEVITDGKNGILFDDGSTEDFVRAISRLLENERLQAQYGAELRKKVESEHTWEDVGRRTEVVLNRVVDTTGVKQKSTSR